MKRKSFTLIEILGVMAIIAILSTLGFAGYSYANNKSNESSTQGLITRLNAAFEIAHQKTGFLPPTQSDFSEIEFEYKKDEDEESNNKIISALVINSKKYNLSPDKDAKRQAKMEAEFCKQFIQALQMDSMKRYIDDDEIVDAWGNKVYYSYPGKLKTGGFDLISAGSDGGFGTEVKETPADDISKYRDGADWICDDIANF